MFKKQLTIGVCRAQSNEAWKDYKKCLTSLGIKIKTIDILNSDWSKRLSQSKVDAFLWHSDTFNSEYRKIHDKIYFIENFLKKPVFPDMNMYYSYNDKLKQYEIFKYLKLPTIPTFVAYSKQEADKILNKIKFPCVIKDSYHAGGFGNFKINSKKELKEIINDIFSSGWQRIKKYLYLQEFVPNMPRDLRIITVGDKIAAAYWRQGNTWKHNVCQGAEVNFNNIPPKAINFCLKISKQQKFHWMSYDLFILPNGKIQLIEWSCNFGIKGPKSIGLDVRKIQSKYIINYLSKHAKRKK